jgi:hypothetical protein
MTTGCQQFQLGVIDLTAFIAHRRNRGLPISLSGSGFSLYRRQMLKEPAVTIPEIRVPRRFVPTGMGIHLNQSRPSTNKVFSVNFQHPLLLLSARQGLVI